MADSLDKQDIKEVVKTLKSAYLTQGQQLIDLKKILIAFLDPNFLAVSNGIQHCT